MMIVGVGAALAPDPGSLMLFPDVCRSLSSFPVGAALATAREMCVEVQPLGNGCLLLARILPCTTDLGCCVAASER